jgi:hypothetical protein
MENKSYFSSAIRVLDRTEDGRIVFPYDEIDVDFVLRAA